MNTEKESEKINPDLTRDDLIKLIDDNFNESARKSAMRIRSRNAIQEEPSPSNRKNQTNPTQQE